MTHLKQHISSFRFTSNAIFFLKSYLLDRKLRVHFMGHKSFEFETSSGVPQVSALGALLFTIFFNDIYFNCATLLLEEDLKLYQRISKVDDCLQGYVNKFNDWWEENSLPLNNEKCKIISFVHGQAFDYPFNIDGEILPWVSIRIAV